VHAFLCKWPASVISTPKSSPPPTANSYCRVKQKVVAYGRWLCEEIIRNKFFSNYNHSCFIQIVSFILELTSYLQFSSEMQQTWHIYRWRAQNLGTGIKTAILL
jgi:hypothetical protein